MKLTQFFIYICRDYQDVLFLFQKLVEQFMTEDIQIGGTADEKLQSQLYIGK